MENNKHEHYYTQSPEGEYKEFSINYTVLDYIFKFKTSTGVFSNSSVDFGTDLLIKTVIDNSNMPDSILDVGCGYGAIGISLGAVLETDVLMIDINERAVKLANKNSKTNNIHAIQSDGFEKVKGTFDMIVTNPPIRAGKEVYYNWFKKSFEYLNDDGEFWCVIRKKQGAPSAKKELISVFDNCEVIKRDAGYYIFKCVKYA